ncbi:hypothetical protein D3C87_1450370 [compost metagenome]
MVEAVARILCVLHMAIMLCETPAEILALATVRIIYDAIAFNCCPLFEIFSRVQFEEELSVIEIELKYANFTTWCNVSMMG